MLRILLICTCTIFFLYPQGSVWASGQINQVLDGLRSKYGKLHGLTVNYTREIITRSMAMLGEGVKGDLATGKIYFQPPYSLKLEQLTPSIETIFADEKQLWWYIPEKRVAHRYPAEKFGKELRVLSDIFRGLHRVEENFVVTMDSSRDPDKYVVELKPDPPWQEINRLLVTLSVNYDIRIIDIVNQLGNITRFNLEGLKEIKDFRSGYFIFSVPQGVQIVEE